MTTRRYRGPLAVALLVLMSTIPAQLEAQAGVPTRIVAEPAGLTLTRGDSAVIRIRVIDAGGATVDLPLRVTGARGAVAIREREDGSHVVRALRIGEHELVATVAPDAQGMAPSVDALQVDVRIAWPAIERVDVAAGSARLFQGTRLRHVARALHADGTERPNATIEWRSSDPSIASVDPFGNVRASAPGRVTISAVAAGVAGTMTHEIAPLPAGALEIRGGETQVQTGDVQAFEAVVTDANGRAISDVPVTWSHVYTPDDSIAAPAAPAQLENGRFVADVPGVYTVLANAGPLSAERSFRVTKRDVVQQIEIMAHGREARVFTTDFWVFEGQDARDYAFTGTKNTDGWAFVWDVTDPGAIFKTDSVQVDARTVNDVKVAPNGRYAALSREGASNRRNGVVILDLADPAHPTIASVYDEDLTGGVHNMFATDDHLFALSGGDKYVIIDVRDLTNPTYVSEFDHTRPDGAPSRVHDVWVEDGIAYSAEWETGVVVVDVGNGRWGGSIENPVFVTAYPLPTGSTHAVFPYRSESTGKFYLFVGDERVQRRGLAWEGTGPDHRQQYDQETGRGGYPRATSGYIQVVDFSDPETPEMVARYEVSEYGTHNLWVEDDILYQAYYEGGVRMVDVSGELMGNLYTQGREIAVFKAHDPLGFIPNAPAAWSVMPFKGRIFFSDINSGLWSLRLVPRRPVS